VVDERALEAVDVELHPSGERPAQYVSVGRGQPWLATAGDDDSGCAVQSGEALSFEACEVRLVELDASGAATQAPRRLEAERCPIEGSTEARCNLARVELAAAGAVHLAAAVNVLGCPRGQLRLGQLPDLERPGLSLDAGNAGLGVDVTSEMPSCTGASRADAVVGVAAPSLVAQQPQGRLPQGVAAWLGDELARDGCGGDEVAVEALGLWLEQDGAAVQASADATPQRVGSTRGGGAPALAVWEGSDASRGYFLGYGDAGDEAVALHFVSRLPRLEQGAASTPALELGEAFRVPAQSAADHVAFARSNVRTVCDGDSGVELGVAWLEGCGGDDATLRFAVVGFAQDARSFCLRGEPIALWRGDAGGERMRPAVTYADAGFFVAGHQRDGLRVDQTNDGGWLVVWAGEHEGASALLGTRVAELDGQPVHPDELLVLDADGGDVRRPSLGSGTGAPVAYHEGDDGGFVSARALACEPAE
jgi:hypothetical protein